MQSRKIGIAKGRVKVCQTVKISVVGVSIKKKINSEIQTKDKKITTCSDLLLDIFFYFKQKTAYDVRISAGVQTCALPICAAAAGGHSPRSRRRRRRYPNCSTFPSRQFRRSWTGWRAKARIARDEDC